MGREGGEGKGGRGGKWSGGEGRGWRGREGKEKGKGKGKMGGDCPPLSEILNTPLGPIDIGAQSTLVEERHLCPKLCIKN